MSSNDPTDQALAAIASILEKPGERPAQAADADASQHDDAVQQESRPEDVTDEVKAEHQGESELGADDDQPGSESEPGGDPAPQPRQPLEADEQPADEDYTRSGPGPLDALRFKWTMRRDDGNYFVDETIGASSLPVSSGPMARTEAIALIDQRERDAIKRFETLRREIVSGPSERGYEEGDEE